MEEKKNIPELRFKGYTETWELRKLIDITTKSFGGEHLKLQLKSIGKEIFRGFSQRIL